MYQKMDSVLLDLYSKKKNQKRRKPGSEPDDKKKNIVQNIRMSYVSGSIVQRESLVGGVPMGGGGRKSIADGALDMSRNSSAYMRNTFNLNESMMAGQDDMLPNPNTFLPNTRIDPQILKSVGRNYPVFASTANAESHS